MSTAEDTLAAVADGLAPSGCGGTCSVALCRGCSSEHVVGSAGVRPQGAASLPRRRWHRGSVRAARRGPRKATPAALTDRRPHPHFRSRTGAAVGVGGGLSADGLSVSDPWTESAMKSRRGLLGTTRLWGLPWHVWAPQARSEAEGGGRSCLVRQSSRGSLGGWLMAF